MDGGLVYGLKVIRVLRFCFFFSFLALGCLPFRQRPGGFQDSVSSGWNILEINKAFLFKKKSAHTAICYHHKANKPMQTPIQIWNVHLVLTGEEECARIFGQNKGKKLDRFCFSEKCCFYFGKVVLFQKGTWESCSRWESSVVECTKEGWYVSQSLTTSLT